MNRFSHQIPHQGFGVGVSNDIWNDSCGLPAIPNTRATCFRLTTIFIFTPLTCITYIPVGFSFLFLAMGNSRQITLALRAVRFVDSCYPPKYQYHIFFASHVICFAPPSTFQWNTRYCSWKTWINYVGSSDSFFIRRFMLFVNERWQQQRIDNFLARCMHQRVVNVQAMQCAAASRYAWLLLEIACSALFGIFRPSFLIECGCWSCTISCSCLLLCKSALD